MKTMIRLARFGAKKRPFFRIVVSASESPRDGRALEVLGQYDPAKGIGQAVINKDRAAHWIKTGAQPTEVVGKILKSAQVS